MPSTVSPCQIADARARNRSNERSVWSQRGLAPDQPGTKVLFEMQEQPRQDDGDEVAEEAAEHAERAEEERREMTRKATLAEDADDAGESDQLERESEAHREAAYDREDAAAERADDAG